MKIEIGKYKHYKGFVVEVIGTALHSETLEEMIIYRHKTTVEGYGEAELWARPAKMWNEMVEWPADAKAVAGKEGKKVKRFEFIG